MRVIEKYWSIRKNISSKQMCQWLAIWNNLFREIIISNMASSTNGIFDDDLMSEKPAIFVNLGLLFCKTMMHLVNHICNNNCEHKLIDNIVLVLVMVSNIGGMNCINYVDNFIFAFKLRYLRLIDYFKMALWDIWYWIIDWCDCVCAGVLHCWNSPMRERRATAVVCINQWDQLLSKMDKCIDK